MLHSYDKVFNWCVCVFQIYDGTMNKNAVVFFLGLSHVLL